MQFINITVGTKVKFLSGTVATVVDIEVRFNQVQQKYQTRLHLVVDGTELVEKWSLRSFNDDLKTGEVEVIS